MGSKRKAKTDASGSASEEAPAAGTRQGEEEQGETVTGQATVSVLALDDAVNVATQDAAEAIRAYATYKAHNKNIVITRDPADLVDNKGTCICRSNNFEEGTPYFNAIRCDRCGKWTHKLCSGYTDEEYEDVRKHHKYYCDNCVVPPKYKY